MIGIIAGIISLGAFIPYVVSIIKGKTKPHRITWGIWAWLGFLIFYSYRASGATSTLWVAAVYVIAPLIVAILSLKYGIGGWNKFDLLCLLSSIAATFLWFISETPFVAIVLYLLIDFFGSLPTIWKSYSHPETEDKLSWLLMVVANFANIFAVEDMQFSIIIYPLYMLFIGSLILYLLCRNSSVKNKIT